MNRSLRWPKILGDWVIGAIAVTVVHFSSPKRAYVVVWGILNAAYPLFSTLYKLFRPQWRSEDWRTLILQRALSAMTRRRPGFDLKLHVLGGDEVDRAVRESAPLILFTAHFGLTLAAPRALADRGHRVALIANPSSSDGWHWGLRERLHVLSPGADVMLRARRVLETGIPLICYVDYKLPTSDSQGRLIGISPNAFRLAYRLGAAILFLASRLESDGSITIEFYCPSQDRLETLHAANLCAAEFASFVSSRTGWPSVVERPKLARTENGVADPSSVRLVRASAVAPSLA
jgi:hypothetical protein